MSVIRPFLAAVKVLAALTLLLGVAYPLALTAAALLMPERADGSPVTVDGRVVGSALLGQQVTYPAYFWPRPSVSAYAGDTSGGSNLAESDPNQTSAVTERRAALLAANPEARGPIPPDAITASSSGLDPDISPEYANWQAPRVAQASGISLAEIEVLIEAHTSRPALGFIGNTHVNVTELNAALARLVDRED